MHYNPAMPHPGMPPQQAMYYAPAQGMPRQQAMHYAPAQGMPPQQGARTILVRQLSDEDSCIEATDSGKSLGKGGENGYVTKAKLGSSKRHGGKRKVIAKQPHCLMGQRIDAMGVALLKDIPALRSHPNIAYVYGYESGGKHSLIMERCSHTLPKPDDLSDYQKRSFGTQCVKVVFDMLKHNIRHNDLHSGNLMVAKDQKTLKVIDFGSMNQNEGALGLVDYQTGVEMTRGDPEIMQLGKNNSPINIIQNLLQNEISEGFDEKCDEIKDSDEKIADIMLLKYKLSKWIPIDDENTPNFVASLNNKALTEAYGELTKEDNNGDTSILSNLLEQEQAKHAKNVKHKFGQLYKMVQGEGAMDSDSEEECRAAFKGLKVSAGASEPAASELKVIARGTNGTATRGGPRPEPEKRRFSLFGGKKKG